MSPQESLDFWSFLLQVIKNPSPWLGAVLGSLFTGGFFGWIAHGRSIRPTLVFLRDPDEDAPRWKIQNVGTGPALNIRIRDYAADKDQKDGTIAKKHIYAYPLSPGEPRSIAWVSWGEKLEADYTDAYGRRTYISIGSNNTTTYKRKYRKRRFCRPPVDYLNGYKPEIELRKIKKENAWPFGVPAINFVYSSSSDTPTDNVTYRAPVRDARYTVHFDV